MSNCIYRFIIVLLLLSSCKPLSQISLKNLPAEKILKNDFEKLNGTFANSPDTITGKLKHEPYSGLNEFEQVTILDQLFYRVPETAYRGVDNELLNKNEKWIKIEFRSSKMAIVSFYRNDSLLFTKKIHGKFKNGYFYLRPKAFIIPLVPLVFGYNFERARIGKSADNLLIDYRINMWGFALVAGSSEKGYTSSAYRKKN